MVILLCSVICSFSRYIPLGCRLVELLKMLIKGVFYLSHSAFDAHRKSVTVRPHPQNVNGLQIVENLLHRSAPNNNAALKRDC
jgi:hypothetical protein